MINDCYIRMADEAERSIAACMSRVAISPAPSMDRTAGEIDMAYKLKLIDYPRRDALLMQLRTIVNRRREQLHAERIARLLGVAS